MDGADLGILLGVWSSCPATGPCPNPEHDCCTTGTPGCSDEACCEAVCAVDPFCCDTAWDGLCVSAAVTICGLDCGSACDTADHDCFTTGGPGCTDIACCELVCAADPFCCNTAWDGLCVDGANNLCGGGEVPANDLCANRTSIGLGLTPFSTVGATTDGPALPVDCEEGFGLALVNDIWFNFVAPATDLLTVSTCNMATFDTRLAVYLGAECDPVGMFLACNDDVRPCGLTSVLTLNTTKGQTYKIRVGGFGGSGTGTLSLAYHP